MDLSLAHILLLFIAAIWAGALNAIAGGGTFFTFPVLLLVGIPPIIANTTNKFALSFASIAGVAGFWKEIRTIRSKLFFFCSFGIIGSIAGSVLLLLTPAAQFEAMIPWLMLAATLLFALGNRAVRWIGSLKKTAFSQSTTYHSPFTPSPIKEQNSSFTSPHRGEDGRGAVISTDQAHQSPPPNLKHQAVDVSAPIGGEIIGLSTCRAALANHRLIDSPPATHHSPFTRIALGFAQLLIGIYGGFFAAGMGILMMALYELAGMQNIHEMNALKSAVGLGINVISALTFLIVGIINWHIAAILVAGALIGGYSGAILSKRLSPATIRGFIVCYGIGMTLYFFMK